MADPTNYGQYFTAPNPLDALFAGQQAGQQQAYLQQQRAIQAQQQQAALTQAQVKAQTLHAALTNPSLATYNAYTLANPEHAAASKQAYDAMDEQKQRAELLHGTEVAGYLNTNRPQDALASIDAKITADKAAGIDTTEEQRTRDLIASGPDGVKAAKAMANMGLAAVLGPEKFGEVYKTLGGEDRAQQDQPGVMAKQAADLASTQATTTNTQATTAKTQAETQQLTNPRASYEAIPGSVGPNGQPLIMDKTTGQVTNAGGAAATTNSGELDNIVDQIIGSESGGVADAKNPRSSATGAGQFIDGTWQSIIGQIHPELVTGKTPAQVLALRNNPQLSREATVAYAAQNADALSGAGLPVNGATIAMAHGLGAQGAQTVLAANPATPLSAILSKDVMAANPQLKGKTAGQYAQGLAAKFGTSPVDASPGDPNATGEDYLKTLPPAQARLIKSIAAGDVAMPSLNRASAANRRLNEQVLQYDPTASAITLDTRRKTRADYTSGQSGQSIKAATTVTGHLGDLEEKIDALRNNGIPLNNKIANYLGQETGNAKIQKALADFNSLKATMAMELTKFYRGSGGAESDVRAFMDQLKPDASPATLHATVQSIALAMQSRMDALRQGYQSGMAGTNSPFPLPAKTESELNRLSGQTQGRQAAAQVLINPQTGQKVQLDAATNTWKPVG